MLSVSRTALITAALLIPGSALASSEESWDQFAKEVAQKCTDAASEIFRKPQIAVDPTGTKTYGVAILFGRVKGGKDRASVICVLDKKTGVAELGSELGSDVVRVRKPKAEGQDDKKKQDAGQNNQMNGNAAGQDDADDDQ
jgi:hypothetical protein